jgi:Neuraminidase (sialidase)
MTRRSGRRFALFAVALVLLAQGAASAADPLRITSPVTLTRDDVNPARLYLAPALAIDPANPLHVGAAVTEMRTKSCTFMRSTDGGQTWVRPDAVPSLASYPFCLTNNRGAFQGQLAFGRDSTLYYALPGWDTADAGTRGNVSILVARSDDLGDSWETVVARDNRGKTDADQEVVRPIGSIAVDRNSGSNDVLYVGYTSSLRGPGTPGNANPRQTTVIVSRDGGRTWGDPAYLAPTAFNDPQVRQQALTSRTTLPSTSPPTTPPAGSKAANPDQVGNFGGFQPVLAVGKDGTAYAIWPANSANLSPGIPTGIFLSKSTDHGATWQTVQAMPFAYNNGSFVQMAWSEEGGPQGTLHVVFEYRERPEVAGLSDIAHIRSTDGGQTWSEPRNVTDDPREALFGQYFPNVQVAPDGRVDVTFYDTRNDPGYRANDVYYTYSTDNGETWSKNERITDRTIDRRIGVWSVNYDMNTPPSLASANDYALIGWDDTRNTDLSAPDALALGGGLQDLMTAAVQFSAIGGGGASSAAKIVLAGVAGLVVVGLVLLGFSYTGSRREGVAPRRVGSADRKPAEVK